MDQSHKQRIESIFEQALQQPESQRPDFVRKRCGDNDALRQEILSLISHSESVDSFLERPATGDRPQEPDIPDRIGNYRILEQLGEGGFGVVYLAEQTQPVRRRVALKVIKLGMDTRQVLARFERERQALALMDHPGVARVLDAGTSPQGRPYFVMEHVAGLAITDYCDRHRVSPKERLCLFMQVCRATQHAHQKGIIHRDIKPSNVLVGIEDDRPVPKIIDFGVAKATEQRLTERTLFTEQGQMIGTPEYMSPEQAEMSSLDVDTRTDIYALGVLLYELMIGHLPFEPSTLRAGTLADVQRIIREQEPPRPSMRLSRLGPGQSEVAERRQVDHTALLKLLEGDLDWIIMKALEKDRTRRYSTASEFEDDIRRYLGNEPVVARPPSTVYRASKFLRRHRIGVTMVSATFIGLVIFAFTTMRLYTRAEDQRDLARVAERQARTVNTFLQDMLTQADPQFSGPDTPIKDIVDYSAAKVDEQFEDDPVARGEVHAVLGWTYFMLGEYGPAGRHTAAAATAKAEHYGADHRETIDEWNRHAQVLMWGSRLEEADTLTTRMLTTTQRVCGPHALPTYFAVSNRALWLHWMSRLDEAVVLFEESLAGLKPLMHPDHDDAEDATSHYWVTLNNYALVLADIGRYREAIDSLQELVDRNTRLHGPDHPTVLTDMINLASNLSTINDFGRATKMFKDVLERGRLTWGEDHPKFLATRLNYAHALTVQGNKQEAATITKEVYTDCIRIYGPDHYETVLPLNNLCIALTDLKQYDEAERHARTLVDICERTRGDDDRATWQAHDTLGNVLAHKKNYDQAEVHIRRSYDLFREHWGPDHTATIVVQNNLARLLQDTGRLQEAVVLLKDAVARYHTAVPEDEATITTLRWNYGRALQDAGQFHEAERVLLYVLATWTTAHGSGSDNETRVLQRLVTLYEAWNKPDQARQYQQRLPATDGTTSQ
jgi:non-specific serine/threonine protein kinase/serine/threonine-protein kinase